MITQNNPVFFKNQNEFREWLEKYHESVPEILVGYYKKHTGKPSMSWSESVDQALCFGWIDGIRRSIDEEAYCIRFTPRRKTSIWSKVNIQKVEELKGKGLMRPAGLLAYSFCKENKSGIYSFETGPKQLTQEQIKIFQSCMNAWNYFQDQPPSYRKVVTHWILSARQEKTRQIRLQKLIDACDKQERLGFGFSKRKNNT